MVSTYKAGDIDNWTWYEGNITILILIFMST